MDAKFVRNQRFARKGNVVESVKVERHAEKLAAQKNKAKPVKL